MSITREHLAQILARSGYAVESEGVSLRARQHAIIQEQKAAHPSPKRKAAAPRDRRADKKADGGDHPRFALTVCFRVSDNRPRDLDGLLSTILDCLVTARGRLAAMDTGYHGNQR